MTNSQGLARGRASALSAALGGVFAPLSFLAALVVFLAFFERQEGFLTLSNWRTIVQSTAVVAIIAVGETVVIITGGIDLSVGRILALATVVAAVAMVEYQFSMPVAALLACATGLACGLANGLITTYLHMPSFIATLGMSGVAYGLALMVSGAKNVSGIPRDFQGIALGELFGGPTRYGIPYPLLLMLAAAAGVHLLLTRTAWGRHVYSIGGNREASRLAGISLSGMTVGVFTLMGLLTGVAAVIYVARTGIGQPTAGVGLELQAIAATVIGGTSLAGGTGGVVGTLIGAFLMAVIQNGCDLKAVEPHWQVIITGLVIWLAASYDGLRRRGTR